MLIFFLIPGNNAIIMKLIFAFDNFIYITLWVGGGGCLNQIVSCSNVSFHQNTNKQKKTNVCTRCCCWNAFERGVAPPPPSPRVSGVADCLCLYCFVFTLVTFQDLLVKSVDAFGNDDGEGRAAEESRSQHSDQL